MLPKLYAARAIDFVLANNVMAMVSYSVAIVVSLRAHFISKDLDYINEFVNSLHGKTAVDLKRPEEIQKLASKYKIPAKKALEYIDGFRKSVGYIGVDQFERYVPHLKDYFFTGKEKFVDFKFYDFDVESVRQMRSISQSQASELEHKSIKVNKKKLP